MHEVIDVHFSAPPEAGADLHAQLLAQSLMAEFAKDARMNICVGAPEDTSSRLFEDLSGFAPNAQRSVMIGLQNLPNAMLGRVDLICLRPLEDELSDFAQRCGLAAEESPVWIPQLLANFRNVIFLDLADFNASRGYAPFVRIDLARNFPARMAPSCAFESARIALIAHGRIEGAKALEDTLAQIGTVVKPANTDALAKCNIHVHLGYNPHQRPAGPTPLDSALCGVYSVLLSTAHDPETILGDYITRMLTTRSYCEIAYSARDVAEQTARMAARFGVMAKNGFRVNPELAAKAGQNDNQYSRTARRLMEILNDD